MTPACMLITVLFTVLVPLTAYTQEFYVDPVNGNDASPGSAQQPFKTLQKAVHDANAQTGTGELIIKLFPGVHLLRDRLDLNPVRQMNDSLRYVLEAVHMPDDADWSPDKMPKVFSVSGDNSVTQFSHSTGILVASAHVSVRGIKFLGNPNPSVSYYYPISKEDPQLADLEVTQCYFIGDKEAAAIQGGIWAHGPNNRVSHCVFYECRNAVLFFNNVDGFSIEHCIVSGAYESAFWLGQGDIPFTFGNNIIVNNHYFLVAPPDVKYSSPFSNSIISGNEHEVGHWSGEKQEVELTKNPGIKETGIRKNIQITLNTNHEVAPGRSHLHPEIETEIAGIKAGIFEK